MAQRIPRTGKEMMDFQMYGKLPERQQVTPPVTPLLELIKNIPTRYWREFGAVKLSPEMGFNSALQFHSLEQLARWLGHNQKVDRNRRLPYQSYAIRSARPVNLETLLSHCSGKLAPELKTLMEKQLPSKLR